MWRVNTVPDDCDIKEIEKQRRNVVRRVKDELKKMLIKVESKAEYMKTRKESSLN